MGVAEYRVGAGEIDLNVAIVGEGPAVVLLHGIPHTWRVWEPLARFRHFRLQLPAVAVIMAVGRLVRCRGGPLALVLVPRMRRV